MLIIVINNTKYYSYKNSELATWNKELVGTEYHSNSILAPEWRSRLCVAYSVGLCYKFSHFFVKITAYFKLLIQ